MKAISILSTAFCITVFGPATVAHGNSLSLDWNWNGLAQTTNTDPDSASGFRSVSDRALTIGLGADSLTGTAFSVSTNYLTYDLVSDPNSLDLVYIGVRATHFGLIGWDEEINGDGFGVAPTWDPTGGTGRLASATTILDRPTVALDASFRLGFLYNASVNGGNVDTTLGFTDGSYVTVKLNAPDWFADFDGVPGPPDEGVATQALLAGPLSGGDGFDATEFTDWAVPGPPLNVVEATITHSSLLDGLGFDVTGRQLSHITFNDTLDIFDSLAAFAFFAAATTADIVPEPSSLPLAALGALVLVICNLRRPAPSS